MSQSTQLEEVSCVICHSTDLHHYQVKGQFAIPLNLSLCKNCGLSFLSPRWTKKRYLQYYAHEYDEHYRPAEVANSRTDDPANFKRYGTIDQRLKSKGFPMDSIKNLLDVGSGEGNILTYFQQHYPELAYFAIEPSEECIQILEGKGVNVLSNDADADWEKGNEGKFDFIIMRHVLEHFMNPLTVLEKVQHVLSDKGMLYLAVPNALHLKAPFYERWLRVVHTYYFNRISLRNILHKAGFEIAWLQEGDEANREELFVVAKKSKTPQKIEIDSSNYELQRKAYEDKMKEEKNPLYQMRRSVGKLVKKLRS
ncbi:MAG: class I SAM-dependent methyltransferase [Bacteroidota bacterium]